MSDVLKPQDASHSAVRQWVLVGAGSAHLQVLAHLARTPRSGVQVVLVEPAQQHWCANLLTGFVAGHRGPGDCSVALEPWVARSGIRWIARSVRGLDASAQQLTLDDGSTLRYDGLSINTEPLQNLAVLEAAMPGVREHSVFTSPLEAFGALWPQVVAMAAQKPLRFAVIGAGAAGIELAMAVRQRLPAAAVTVLSGDAAPGADYPAPVRGRIKAALQQRRVTVLQDRASGISAGVVHLASGATLACDVSLVTTGVQPPQWLQGCGLALDAHGCIAVDAYQRSTSHPQVFAASSSHSDSTAAHNLLASLDASALTKHRPPKHALHLISCADHTAIAHWGPFSAQGRWVGWLKDWTDRRIVRRYPKAIP